MQQFRGRAYYNMLRFEKEPNVEKWQVEDYRTFTDAHLFTELKEKGLTWDLLTFQDESTNYDSPESMVNDLEFEENEKSAVFLIIFELWRRFLKEKQSLSIFCDELDFLIQDYEDGTFEREDQLQSYLVDLESILEKSLDTEEEYTSGFNFLCSYLSNSVEEFLYDYISDQIDLENYTYASELIDGFFVYVEDKIWFDFLKARLILETSPDEAMILIQRIIDKLSSDPDLDLTFDLLRFLIYTGDADLFLLQSSAIIDALEEEEDLSEFILIVADYFGSVNEEAAEKDLMHLSRLRDIKKPSGPLSKDSEDLKKIKQVIQTSSTEREPLYE